MRRHLSSPRVQPPPAGKKRKKSKEAPDWFGCGRKITAESWNAFAKAYREYKAPLIRAMRADQAKEQQP